MIKEKPLIYSLMAILAAYFLLSFSWTHAAVVSAVSKSDCPSELLADAKIRVEKLFGEQTSEPTFACLAEPTLGLDISHGTTRFAPGMPALVILGPKGLNTDVAAHEWVHAELASQTSVLKRTYRVPTWFDEGLAMQVDNRKEYLLPALANYLAADLLRGIQLVHIASPNTFFKKNLNGKAHYALSKCVVARWIAKKPGSGLPELLTSIAWTSEFPHSDFSQYLDACLQPQAQARMQSPNGEPVK